MHFEIEAGTRKLLLECTLVNESALWSPRDLQQDPKYEAMVVTARIGAERAQNEVCTPTTVGKVRNFITGHC